MPPAQPLTCRIGRDPGGYVKLHVWKCESYGGSRCQMDSYEQPDGLVRIDQAVKLEAIRRTDTGARIFRAQTILKG